MAQPATGKYESPLRAAQVEQTRAALVDAAVQLLGDEGSDGLTIRAVAARAGISVPTAYRYFPSRDDLLDAVGVSVNALLGFSNYPDSLETAPDFAWVLYPGFEQNEVLIRAQLAFPAGREVRSRAVAKRTAAISASTERSLPDLPPEVRNSYAALVHLLLSASAWSHLHDRWGLDGDQAARLTSWALRILITEIERHPYAISDQPTEQP